GSDLNVAKDSELFRGFLGNSGLIDIFNGDQAPTFHQDFLESGHAPPCIDFILASGGLIVKKMQGNRMFQEKTTLENYGNVFLTDHQGLSATLSL
ncbi:MAG TPA: endonuclease/exonuclease/phosphatase family protein, partial [Candidatus Saccharimonadales bacterium]|nr:endonuclease/exonuclease/phosphatase family protein [Candidatus Saccharimonadales bacterium]